jgi:hypothetical protein
MWDLQMANPLGRLSMRKLLTFVAALIVTVFAYTLATAPTAFAADAAWNGGNLSYESNQYNAMADAKEGDSTGIPAGSKVYGYSTNPADGPQKAYLIYFEPGVDPKTATSAKTVNYSYTPPSTYTNKSSVGTISIDSSSANNPTSTCTVEGVGWIVCSLSSFLAEGMDNVFNLLTGFVAVQPIRTSDQSGDLYKAWDVMRSFANIVFIIGFLVIIYSQLTSTGVSNYGIKKLLPRIIVAAILVNISYYICAIAVDITNILGYSLQHIFIQIRENLFGIHGNTWSDSMGNWASVTGFVLSGGATVLALGAGGAAALAATGGTAAAAIFLLLPILVGALITILVVLLILAARQAIIVILIIISPLAFVAYLLPGTEKWFEKWKDLFMTMMIFFPAFSMVFGGAQLAGAVIIQNATSINLIILGLAVQVAPLAIAPLLMKLSGGFLNRIAGIVNNPGKGLVDRTRKWAGEHADYHRQRGIGGDLKKRNFLRKGARSLQYKKDRLSRGTERWKQGYEEYSAKMAATDKVSQKIEVDLQISKLNTENWQNQMKKAVAELRAGSTDGVDQLRGMADESIVVRLRNRVIEMRPDTFATEALRRAQDADQESRVLSQAIHSADHVQEHHFAEALEASADLRARAGGIQGIAGAQRALASAISAQSKAHGEAVSNATTIINHGNYTDDVVGELALGNSGSTGIIVTDDMREAAIMKIAGGANTSEILKLMENIEINPSKENQDFRQAFADTLIANGNKPKFAGAGIIAEMKKGNAPAPGKARIDKFVSDTINSGKMGSADLLVTHDKEYLSAVLATLKNNSSGVTLDSQALTRIKSEINKAKTNDLYSGKIGERASVLDEIDKLI